MVLMVFTEVTGLREADEFLEMLFEKSPSLSVYWKSREKISQIFRNLSCIALPAVCYSLSWRKKKITHTLISEKWSGKIEYWQEEKMYEA